MHTFATTKEGLALARTQMEKSVEDFRREVSTLRTGRASAALLDHIRVDYHGTPMPVNQLGTLTVPDPTLIVVSPWDRAVVPLIEKAVLSSDLGLNPASDGRVIRIPIPPLNEERRKEMVKHLHRILEEHRSGIRNARRDVKEGIERLEKDKKIGEDDRTRSLDELEKITHQETKKMEDLSASKEKEILEIR
ncbi:MAG TPA: ribosome recycling factor [Candidatus Dormibacteraeota bacterium]|nr:ribosome recycling factor [Candidatus Dormibacteraeota bacterium]